ncbi:hypothetical protein GA0061099_10315 [Bradyrhizobium yuanmingense]|uniref:Uncharacterized protein n=1 Tax=Bradyrhizobium yuanmingense TaxID=108015 RepID=A0A1C3XJ94_9BRAD|nr:hypothetical protein [Bradyrhizobium yuanmingense]TWI17483.1 hypothetical protein IQ15_07415 [Bradyrhizobium yuanmingense]SCB52338.1 hypothetical protein GA0061099_10315 [Bradyrhizobium yuanmingense]
MREARHTRFVGSGKYLHVELAYQPPDSEYDRIEHMKVLRARNIAIDGVAVVGISIVEQMRHELVCAPVPPEDEVELVWPSNPVG